jgi:hypothetical protein
VKTLAASECHGSLDSCGLIGDDGSRLLLEAAAEATKHDAILSLLQKTAKLHTIERHESINVKGADGSQGKWHGSSLAEVTQPTRTTVTHTSFFSRLKNSFAQFIFGLVAIMFSFPVLWFNEKRSAKFETLISRGETKCRKIEADAYDEDNTNWPVYAVATTSSVKPIEDIQFHVRFDRGVIKLSREVEIFQWVEETKSKTEEQETLGGGKDTVTTEWKEYTRQWLTTYNDGSGFEEPGHTNRNPEGINPGIDSKLCDRVEFGKDFILDTTLLIQLDEDTTLTELPGGGQLRCKANTGLKFVLHGQYFCTGAQGSYDPNEPKIGDARVKFKAIKDGIVTVLALQAEADESQKPSKGCFLPYRVIQRPLCSCSFTEEQEKELNLQEATKDDFTSEAIWGGPLGWCCCCPCNLVACACASMVPELHKVWYGKRTKEACFKDVKNEAMIMKWCLRFLGWFIMFLGLCGLFTPFTTLINIIPVIGPWLASLGGAIVGVFSFLVTLVIAVLIIAMAYSIYHPVWGLIVFTALGGIIALILVLGHALHPAAK